MRDGGAWSMFDPDLALRGFAAFLEREHLDELAAKNVALVRQFDIPLMRLFADLPPETLLQMTREGLARLLQAFQAGTAEALGLESLRKWEADELPGIPKDAIEPSDLVLANGAQKQAMLAFLARYDVDRETLTAVVLGLERHYQQAQDASFQLFTRLRREDAERHAEAQQTANEELTAQTEELTAQTEELASQQEELQALTDRLAADKAFIETIVANAPAAIAYLEKDLTFRWVNPAFAQLVGLPREGLAGRPLAEAFPAMPLPNPRIEQALRSAQPAGAEGFKVEVGARTYFTDHTYVPMLDRHGAVEGLLLLALDVTARVESDRMKDQFLSILSHELRTPINAIMGFGSILEDELGGPLTDTQHGYLKKIMGGAQTLMALVSDLLDMSRIQAGKFTLDPRPIRLPEVLDDVVAYLEPLAAQKHLHLEAPVDPELPVMVADEQRVAQILTNLLSNAIKFTPEDGTITVNAWATDHKIRCEVQDTGIGIAPNDIPRLFQRFTQLDSSYTRKAGGTGLGLSISKALVEAHGGKIGVKSEPGKGSMFWFELPTTVSNS
ncbi:MAG: sensory transduction histidine kinase [Cyanobacteria bacterium RYN_339]|nr:sensory transduction histidine kinase [Cyanobacteria bacterium RYN_339]